MARRWLAVASALMLAWTFFLGAALATRAGLTTATASSHVCACQMCKGGTKKSCCCTGDAGYTLRASCDMADVENLLLVSIPAYFPPAFLTPLPLWDSSLPEAIVMASVSAPTRISQPPYTPPRTILS